MNDSFSVNDAANLGSEGKRMIPALADIKWVQAAMACKPIRVAVVHSCDAVSLKGAIEASDAGLIIPIFVAPRRELLALAASLGLDLRSFRLEDVADSRAAAVRAASLASSGEVDALMKGSLHTDVFVAAVVAEDSGLHTGRRVSHCFVMDTPSYARSLIITDGAIHIAPTLDEKADIIRNAIDLATVLGVQQPRVAVLAAVETVNDRMQSTLDAAALSKMADRGQIVGAFVDGPLALDDAISVAAATTKGIVSTVAGRADILLVPDIESGNTLAKALEYLGGARAAGIALGAKVPLILTSRADTSASRIASAALAVLVSNHPR